MPGLILTTTCPVFKLNNNRALKSVEDRLGMLIAAFSKNVILSKRGT